MSLTLSVNNALSGLRVNQSSLAILSGNIANANTEGYSRKVTDQSTVTLNGVGAGVSIDDISRKIDVYLQRAIRTQTSVTGRAETINDYADRLQILLGSPGSGTGLNAFITNVFNSLQSLAEAPERSSNRINVVNAAQSFVDEMKSLVAGIQELRFDADQEISTSVNTVNLKLRELYDLNTAIANARVLGRPTSELADKQDAALKEIAKHLDINTFSNDDGTINVYARGGAILLDRERYELDYDPINSAETLFVDDPQFSALRTFQINAAGERISESIPIVTGGSVDEVTTSQRQGRIKALLETRDENLTGILEQLDNLAAVFRDELNAVHNAGSGFPGNTVLTGTRSTTSDSVSNWLGQVRIGLVDVNGQPIASPFASESGGIRPLTIDLSTLNAGTGDGPGYPETQTIINEINNYYGVPRNKVSLGNLNNIELASNTSKLPGGFFSFDFDLENISGSSSQFFVTSVSVMDDTATDITSVTSTIPSVALDGTNTYTTQLNSANVTVAAANHGLTEGDYVFLPTPTSGVGGITSTQLGGLFQVTNVTSMGFDIVVQGGAATSNATLSQAGTAYTTYYDSTTGTYQRTTANGTFTADLIGNVSSSYYDVQANVTVVNEDGSVESSVITYRVNSDTNNMYNKRFGAVSATGAAVIEAPTQRNQSFATATLVDADGNEVPKINGRYVAGVAGFLQLETASGNYYLSVDSLNSAENGDPSGTPFIQPGTNRGFSHYFELNNFFTSNLPTSTGDTVLDSARNLAIESRIRTNPGNISTGRLVQVARPSDPDLPPLYTYERISGDDSIAQELANLANSLVTFDQAGGLSASQQTLTGYAGEILGYAGSQANTAESNVTSTKVILEGFQERMTAIAGVNLDEELANMLLYQNAYTASAKALTIATDLMESLLQTLGR